jgi:hypothetical protein
MIRDLMFVLGAILVAAPGIATVAPTFGRLLPGPGTVLPLIALGAVLVCVAAIWCALRVPPAPGSRSRILARVFLAASIAVQTVTFVGVFRSPPGTFAAVGFVAGAVVVAVVVAPLLLVALAFTVHAYVAGRRPVVRLAELVGFVLAGFVLMLPALRVLGIAHRAGA